MNALKFRRKDRQADKFSAITKRTGSRKIIISTILVLLTCWVITYLIWNAVNTNTQNELRLYFEFRARDVNGLIKQRLANYEQVLRSVRGLYNASGKVNRAEFHTFFNSLHLDKSYPGIQGVGFSLIIPQKQLKKHTAGVRAEGFSNYKIWPEGKRQIYTSIIYLEPFKHLNLRAFGYDMFSEPVRRKAMEMSRDSDETQISGKITLVQETGKEVQAGFLIYLPVYRNGTSHKTVLERRANINGWVYSPFRMNDFMAGLLGERSPELDIEIYDGTNISNKTKMYASKEQNLHVQHKLASREIIDVDGHKWTVIVKSTHVLESRIEFTGTTFILIAGFVLSLLLATITWLVEKKRMLTGIASAERWKVENELKISELKFRNIVEGTKAILFSTNRRGIFTYLNEAACTKLEMGNQELLGKFYLKFVHPSSRAKTHSVFSDQIENPTPNKSIDVQIITKSGKEGWLSILINPIYEEGKVAGLSSVALDITERKHTDLILRESEERFRSVAQSANDAIITSNIGGEILGWNKGAEKLFGYTEAEAAGKSLNMIMPRIYIEDHNNGMKRVEHSGERHVIGKTVELIGLHKGGKEFPLELSLAEWETSKDKFFTGIIRDITERKQAEEEIKRSNNQLIKINAEKDKFFSIIAHDLKSPFTGFLNLTELMADKTEEFSLAEFIKNSKSLNEAARYLYKLLENLLEWAQMQKGSIRFLPEEINLSDSISHNIQIINQRALQKGITIINEVPDTQIVFADGKMVATVFRNLLSNAIKFTKRGGKIIIRSKKTVSGMVEVSVSDNGVGIPEKDFRRLFKIEEKVSSKGTEGEPSTGLGLLLCKEFVERNGGYIWAESEVENLPAGKAGGSTFYFTIPQFPLNTAI